jgi:hypothetical protein
LFVENVDNRMAFEGLLTKTNIMFIFAHEKKGTLK